MDPLSSFLSEFFGQRPPSTPVFADVVQGSPKSEMVNNDVAAMLRKQMFDTAVLCVGIVHDGL